MWYLNLYWFIYRRSTKSRGSSSIWASWAKLLYLCFNKRNRQRLRWSRSGSMDESDAGLQGNFILCRQWFFAKIRIYFINWPWFWPYYYFRQRFDSEMKKRQDEESMRRILEQEKDVSKKTLTPDLHLGP